MLNPGLLSDHAGNAQGHTQDHELYDSPVPGRVAVAVTECDDDSMKDKPVWEVLRIGFHFH